MSSENIVKRLVTAVAVIIIVGAVLETLIATEALPRQDKVPSNPIAGRLVFEEKGCIDCHSIDGYGGNIGPDLGKDKFFGSFYDLASRLWNHAPQMVVRTDFLEKEWPSFSRRELDQLTGYLFYLRFLGEPGSVKEGRRLLSSKNCLKCHRIGGEGARKGIALDDLKEFASPLYIAQVIWNHGPAMQDEMDSKGIDRPSFDDDDITNISVFLRESSRGAERKKQFMSPGNPEKGALLFKKKGCVKCHATDAGKSSKGTRLSNMNLHRSVTAIAGSMWNHGNIMQEMMKETGVNWPTFEGSEMADLISYLYFYDYQKPPGDPALGKQVFNEKSCVNCHGSGKEFDLGKDISLEEPSDLVVTMWNHVPHMQEIIVTRNIEWPELSPEELRNLYAFLLQSSAKD